MQLKINSKLGLGVKTMVLVLAVLMFTQCDESLPGEGSLPDLTPPSADFSYKSNPENFREISFTNLSVSSNQWEWDFGDGNTSTEKSPTHIYSGEGSYSATLTARDGNNVADNITLMVDVVDELVPEFQCKSFECSDRSVWGSFSGSGSPSPPDGSTGAKLESESHFLDQSIVVRPSTNYRVSFWYVSASSTGDGCGDLRISDGTDDGVVFVEQSMPLTDNASDYIWVSFDVATTGTTDALRFQLTPGDVTGRYDLVEIVKVE